MKMLKKGGKDLEYQNGSLYVILWYNENNETGLVTISSLALIVRKTVENEKIKQCVKCMT